LGLTDDNLPELLRKLQPAETEKREPQAN